MKLDFQKTSFSVVGGIKYPKHFGQSGHPIPLPVILTIEPAKITSKTNKNEVIIDAMGNEIKVEKKVELTEKEKKRVEMLELRMKDLEES